MGGPDRIYHDGSLNNISLAVKKMVVAVVFLFFGCTSKMVIIDRDAELPVDQDKEEIFFSTDSGYVPLSKGKLSKVIKEFPITEKEIAIESTYKINGEFTLIKKDKTLKFIINSSNDIKLVKLSEDNTALVRDIYMTEIKDKADFIEEQIEKSSENSDIRTAALEAGEYAYITKTYYLDFGVGEPIIEPVFLFKVIE